MNRQGIESSKWETTTSIYDPKDSWLFRWEPRVKIVAALIYVLMMLTLTSILSVIFALAMVMFATKTGGVSVSHIVRRIRWVLPFLLFMSLPLLFGDGLQPSTEQYQFTGMLFLKALTSVTVMIVLMCTQSMEKFFQSIANMGLPSYLITILFLTSRYIFLFRDYLRDVEKALKSRSFQIKTNKRMMATIGEIMGGMFVSAFDRSDAVHQAMVARGFDGTLKMGRPASIKQKDWVLAGAVLVTSIIIILIDKGGIVPWELVKTML